MNGATVFVTAIGYVLLLFLIAWWGDRGGRRFVTGRPRLVVYALSLAVYCTSWTYYGSVGLASTHGLEFLPIYIGPILVMGLGAPLVARIANLARSQNLTTVADFVSARYGKSQATAAVAALIALIGLAPYVALQLKAASTTLITVVHSFDTARLAPDRPSAAFSLAISAGLAAFAIAFGTRRINPKEHQNGLILAIAVESIVKLAAFLGVGAFVVWGLSGGIAGLTEAANSDPRIASVIQNSARSGRLGRHHAAVGLRDRPPAPPVPCHGRREPRRARDPHGRMALSGLSHCHQPVRRSAGDRRAPNLSGRRDQSRSDGAGAAARGQRARRRAHDDDRRPLRRHRHGGARQPRACDHHLQRSRDAASAAAPRCARGAGDIGALVLWVRRLSIVGVLALGFAYERLTSESDLVSIGLLSFAAVAQIAPAFLGGLFWRRGTARGAIAGMTLGSLAWAYLLFLPSIGPHGAIAEYFDKGPLAIGWLSPASLVSFAPNALVGGAVLSLLVNIAALVVFSLTRQPSALERTQANAFAGSGGKPQAFRLWGSSTTTAELEAAVARYLGASRAHRAFSAFVRDSGLDYDPQREASAQLIRHAEFLLSPAIGASTSRQVLSLILRPRAVSGQSALKLIDEASAAIQTSRDQLQHALDHARQGITVFDSNLALTAWNREFVELFDLPASMLRHGIGLDEIVRFNASRGAYGPGGLRRFRRRARRRPAL